MTGVVVEKRTSVRVLVELVAAVVLAAGALWCVWYPMHVIRPFRPQDPVQLDRALWMHDGGPWIAGACATLAVALTSWTWGRIDSRVGRWSFGAAMVALCGVAMVCAYYTNVNFYETKMFHPYGSPEFESADASRTEPNDMVLAVKQGGHARAYPILTIGYHHVVNDTVAGVPIAMTYCTLCHSGIAWDPMVGGWRLHFRLAGINNGNALLRDEETGSVWQQSTGEAIYGLLKGHRLTMIHSDEMSFALWKREQPGGDVLKPDARWVKEYDGRDWESQVEKTPVMVDTRGSGIEPHRLMLGVEHGGSYKAYPMDTLMAAKFIQDKVGGEPVLIVVGPDRASIRAFNSSELTFTPVENGMRDEETGSTWNFEGCAVNGRLAGRCLTSVDAFKEYWFDWMNHHPETAVFKG
jgi:hypothetical protein